MSAIADRYRRLSTEFTRRVEAVPADRWDNPSPCADWTARDVLRHVIETHVSTPTRAGETVELEQSVDEDPAAAWAEARDAMQSLLDDPTRAGRTYEGMSGPTAVEQTVDMFLGLDQVVHAWDIARATGQDETMPAEDVEELSRQVEQMGDMLQKGGACGPVVDVPSDASAQDRLLGRLGRRP